MNESERKKEWMISLTRGVAGLTPVVGPILAEVVGNLIPDQRMERLEGFARALDDRLGAMEQQVLRERLKDPRVLDLLEDGLHHAARALTEERLRYIAALVAEGLSPEGLDAVRAKHLLGLLREINDVEVILLLGHAHETRNDESFWERHETTMMGPTAVMGSPQSEIDQHTVHQSYLNHLVSVGLLRQIFAKPKRGEAPEIDPKTGMVKAQGHEITPLGNLMLRTMQLLDEEKA